MNIPEFAAEIGVAHQSVYRKLKKNKIKPGDLYNPKTGGLSRKGKSIIAELFRRKPKIEFAEVEFYVEGELRSAIVLPKNKPMLAVCDLGRAVCLGLKVKKCRAVVCNSDGGVSMELEVYPEK